MLLRFGVQNHLSIRDYQELSCVASGGYDDLEHTIVINDLKNKEKEFLPVVAVYGANAAGKSNILDAISFFRKAIRRSYYDWEEMETLPQQFFSLNSFSAADESSYDCEVVIDEVRYHYGFSLTAQKIVKEWLYYYPKGTRNIIFQRDFSELAEVDVYFGPSLKKVTNAWRQISLNDKILMLSASSKKENEHEQLTPVYKYFRDKLISVRIGDERNEYAIAEEMANESVRIRISEALKSADFGIIGIELEKVPVPEDALEFSRSLYEFLNSKFENTNSQKTLLSPPKEQTRIYFRHAGCEGETYLVRFDAESSGTRYLMGLLVPVMSALESGATLIVDEITTNLHTKLSEKIIQLFTSRETNLKNAQFIFSTHDTNLLSRELLRRDEIWFAEKDCEGATSVYPLSDFKTRKSDNIEKGYLQGRFGAIPFMGDIGILLR